MVDIRCTVWYNDIIIKKGVNQMGKKKKKRQLLEKMSVIVSIISSLVAAMCMLYETFFK